MDFENLNDSDLVKWILEARASNRGREDPALHYAIEEHRRREVPKRTRLGVHDEHGRQLGRRVAHWRRPTSAIYPQW